MKRVLGSMLLGLCTAGVLAKLPPLSDEAKAKAAEAAAKTAHAGKVNAYKVCLIEDRLAAAYLAEAKKAGKDLKPVATPPCVNPGPLAGAEAPAAKPAAPHKAAKKS
ncbi:MAG: hypothetical protein HS128_17275 [Ideonella sp.]|nr:hypothetical protein [Ideonella sp.]MCC7458733.1 hypothetical protein [Nitrospira sp.]